VPHAAQQRFHHWLVAEKVVPLVVDEVRRNDGGVPVVALLDQLEKDVRLFRLEIQIAKFVDQ